MAVLIYKDSLYTFDGKSFQTITPAQAKKERIGAFVPLEHITTLTFKLPMNLDEEQLALQIELKMYNEGGLDPNKEYKIDWITYRLESEESFFIEAFAVDIEKVTPLYENMVKKVGYIDLLFPRFIAYKAFYTQDFQVQENHLILSFSDEESFGVIYQAGRYIGYRQIDSLSQIAKKLGYEVTYIKSLLAEKGIVQERYGNEEKHIYEALSEILYKNVEKLVYAINFKRSYFGLDKIDRVFLDFDGGMIDGLRELFLSFGVEGEYLFEPYQCCEVDTQNSFLVTALRYIDQFHTFDQKLNLSFFERRKPLYQFLVVQYFFIIFLVGSLLMGVLGYLFVQQQKLIEQKTSLKNRLTKEKKIEKKYLAAIKEYKQNKKVLSEELAGLETTIQAYQNTLQTIPFIQSMKLSRQQMINDLIEGLYHYRLSTKMIDQEGTKRVDVDIVSKNSKRDTIAKFMKELLQKNYSDVFTKKIVRHKNFYESKVRIVR